MPNTYSLLPKQNKESGQLLLELLLSIIATVTFITLVLRSWGQVFPIWTSLARQTSLYDVSHYIFTAIEKNTAYDSQQITITKDYNNNPKLVCQTVQGNLSYIFTLENKHIYKTTQKSASSGKNPVYVSECEITNWQIRRISEHELLIELTLAKDGFRINTSHLLYCLNGSVVDDC